MRRRFRALAAALVMAAMVTGGSAGLSLWQVEHNGLLAHINYFRYVSGLPPVQVHWDLEDDAIRHAKEMAVAQTVYHSPSLGWVTSGWSRLGENVGAATTIEGVMHAWFDSPPHRANLLGDWRYIGVGNYRAADGRVYVAVIFMR
jgi:uncharacterized protein YkwD